MNNTARRTRRLWTELIDLYALRFGLRSVDLDAHAAEHHYAAGDRIRPVVLEAATCLAQSGDVHACV